MEILEKGYLLSDVKSILAKDGKTAGIAGLRYMVQTKLHLGNEYRKTDTGKLIVYESGLNVLKEFYNMKRRGK